jgi:glycine/D-amino acid oxidase-like deaminating enzyme
MLTGGPSYWFHALGGLPKPRPALPGSTDVDVAIVGGGFTGLWTAYYLKRADPSLRIAILESEVCGYGASGRNGGWVCGAVAGFGDARTQAAIDDTVDEIGRVTAAEQIACDYHKGGAVHVVTGAAQLPVLRGKAGWLEPNELAERIRFGDALGGVFEPNYARVQPAALARGLADVVERLGVGVYEATPVESIASGLARTAYGDVRAGWVVRATEGYTPQLAGAPGRQLLPLRSTMVVTEPLSDGAWAEIGWRDAELVHDAAHSYVYIQRTADGRIAIGGRGRPYYYGSGHDSYGEVETWAIDRLEQRLHELWPQTRGVEIAHGWSGVFAAQRDWKQSVVADRASGIAWAGGYVGVGVCAANLSGRALADLIRGEQTDLVTLPFVNREQPRDWEPEPFRFLGANLVYTLFRAADRQERRTGKPSPLGDLATRISGWGHRAPAGE